MKSCLLLLQTFLIIIVLVTRQEYLYRGLKTDVSTSSNSYENAELEIIISSIVFFVFLLLEFFAVLTGVSIKFLGVTSFQVLLHFYAVSWTIWTIFERRHYRNISYICGIFGLTPFVLEILVLIANFYINRVKYR